MFRTLFTHLRPCPSLQYVFAPLVQFNEDETLWPPCGGCGLGQSHVTSTPHTRLCLEHVCARNCCCCATSTSTPGNGSVQRLSWHRWAQTCQTPITITKCTSVLCPHLALGYPLPPADGNQPLVLTYADLDPNVQYRVRVVYSYQGWSAYPLQSLWAVGADNTTAMLHDDQVPLSPPTLRPFSSRSVTRDVQPAPQPLGPQEWDVPKKTTATGQVSIRCVQSINNGGSSRGCLISEVNDVQQRACLRLRGSQLCAPVAPTPSVCRIPCFVRFVFLTDLALSRDP